MRTAVVTAESRRISGLVVESSTAGSGAAPAKRDREQTRAIRKWANKDGYELSGRGRIFEHVIEASDNVH